MATASSATDAAPLLSSLYAQCCSSFTARLSALDEPKRDVSVQMRRKDVDSEFGKLQLWGRSVGARHAGSRHHQSLDYRLRRSPFHRQRVLQSCSDRRLPAKARQVDDFSSNLTKYVWIFQLARSLNCCVFGLLANIVRALRGWS